MQIILITLFIITKTTISAKDVIGYYPSIKWIHNRTNVPDPETLDFSKVSIINYAFFQTDIHGNIYGTDSLADSRILFGPIDHDQTNGTQRRCSHDAPGASHCNYHFFDEGLISLVHKQQAQIFPSIGGYTFSHNFANVAASDTTRKHFAKECVELIKDYDFDGIDMNWQYPASSDDKQNFFLLLYEIRVALDNHTMSTGKYYQITAALPCSHAHIANIDVPYTTQMLDQMNLMTYDIHDSGNDVTAVYASISDVDSCVKYWIDKGAMKDKINVALPFHGRSYRNANGLNQPHDGVDTVHWIEDEGMPQYYNILKKLNEMISVRDERTKTQYAYLYDNSGLVSYDDPVAICDKVEYVLDNELNGLVIWDITGDVMHDLSTPLLDEVNLKLMFPDEHKCGGFGPDPTPHPTLHPTTSASNRVRATSITASDSSSDCVYSEEYVQSLLLEIRHLEQILEEYNDGISDPTGAPTGSSYVDYVTH